MCHHAQPRTKVLTVTGMTIGINKVTSIQNLKNLSQLNTELLKQLSWVFSTRSQDRHSHQRVSRVTFLPNSLPRRSIVVFPASSELYRAKQPLKVSSLGAWTPDHQIKNTESTFLSLSWTCQAPLQQWLWPDILYIFFIGWSFYGKHGLAFEFNS